MGMRASYRCEDCGYEHTIYPGGLDWGMKSVVRQVRCSSCNEIVEFSSDNITARKKGEEWLEREQGELSERSSANNDNVCDDAETDEASADVFNPFGDWARLVLKYDAKCQYCESCDFEETADWEKLENEDSDDSWDAILVKCPKCGGKMKMDLESFAIWD